jgi:Na+(H+)/acetate symporter ActP
LWVNVVRGGRASDVEQLGVARVATVFLGILSIFLGIAFKGQNVAYMVGLAFAIAASANFPALVLSIFWRGFTTRGAQASILIGTASALLLIYLSPCATPAWSRFPSRSSSGSRSRSCFRNRRPRRVSRPCNGVSTWGRWPGPGTPQPKKRKLEESP